MRLAGCVALLLPVSAPAAAQADRQGAGGATDFFYSTDSEGSEVVRLGVDFDLSREGQSRYIGLRVEEAWYEPSGEPARSRERVYVRAASVTGKWHWKAQLGTDGDSLVGAVSIHHDQPFRKELFVERDIVETRQGLDRGLYATFAGVAVDIPADDRNVITALVGAQAFSGDNTRLHLRGNFVHVLKPEWGLSVQARGRYFHSTEPGEFDYYSPQWYAEILPVIQMRRFVAGWELLGAAGLGGQRDSQSSWRQSRYGHVRFRSPSVTKRWGVHGSMTYSNTPSTSSLPRPSYSYVQFNVGVSSHF